MMNIKKSLIMTFEKKKIICNIQEKGQFSNNMSKKKRSVTNMVKEKVVKSALQMVRS